MDAIEFRTNVRDGGIEIPDEYKSRVKGQVRVIVLSQESQETAAQTDLIARLLAHPLQLDDFEPLAREQIYERP